MTFCCLLVVYRREIVLAQQPKQEKRLVLKFQLSRLCCQSKLCLLRETEHLDGVCEQIAAACLMTTWTSIMHRSWSVCVAQRHKQLHHAGMCRAWAGTSIFTIIVQLKF